MIFKDAEELQTKCLEWQKILRLQDWIAKATIKRRHDMTVDKRVGECEFRLKTKIAAVRILDPVDYPEDIIIPYDMEQVLVHELLHLHFAPLYANTEDDSIDDAQEVAIDSIACGLVNLYRK